MTKLMLWCVSLLVLFGLFTWRASTEWSRLEEGKGGEYRGWVTLVSDPEPASVTRVVLKACGERWVAYVHGVAARRINGALAGEKLRVVARLERGAPKYLKWRHVVGRIEIIEVSEVVDAGGPVVRATNRLRRTIARGARTMTLENASLFSGLVIGDDRNQSQGMIQDFRAAGMSHLTAVSGQNVALVLAAFAPVLTRLQPRRRFGATVALIIWFVVLTRAEPSVLRAAGMSVISAVGFLRGRKMHTLVVLGTCVTALLLVDPLLAWSVGWWLSVSASLGIALFAAPITSRLPLPQTLSELVGATVSAQLATMPISLAVFGRFAPLGLFANVLSVPVAGMIMFAGIPLGLLSGVSPAGISEVLMSPIELAVLWVKFVAGVFSV